MPGGCLVLAAVTVRGLEKGLSEKCSCVDRDVRTGTYDMALTRLQRQARQRQASLIRIDSELAVDESRTHLEECCAVKDVSLSATLFQCARPSATRASS